MAKDKKKLISIIILFLIGLSVIVYPLISRTYYDFQGNEEVENYEEELAKISDAEIKERLQLSHAYNNALLSDDEVPIGDPFSEKEKEEGIFEYIKLLEVSEKIGTLTIPKMNMKFPVYAGTSEKILQKGVGHIEGTSLPVGGLNRHAVLTAHRGLPKNKLFTDLDKLKTKDLFFIKTIAGELAYEVTEIKVIEPTAVEELGIKKDKDLVTLLTCTPFMINSHRLLVTGERTELPNKVQEEATDINWWDHLVSLLGGYIWFILALILLIVFFIIRKRLAVKGRD